MRFHVFATDYDGTIAHDGLVDENTRSALNRVRSSGRKLILVTGRELPDLMSNLPPLELFDLAVIENGAVLFNPLTKELRVLTEPPAAHFVAELQSRGVNPLSIGRVIVATTDLHRQTVLETIHDLGLELQVIFNKGSLMVLPSGVNKATGLKSALIELGLSLHNTVGVGDAENDHAFMKVCECSAAVANALPSVKEFADIVLKGKRGNGVVELIERLLANDLSDQTMLTRHRIHIGTSENGIEHYIDPAGAGILVCGTSGSGKSTLTTSLLEQLTDREYQVLVIDPEGDYTNLEFTYIIGGPTQAPTPEEVIDALRDPKRSVVVNLLGVPLAERPRFFDLLLLRIMEVKSNTGRPHWLVLDEAHHLLQAGPNAAGSSTSLPDRGTCFITVHPGAIEPKVLNQIQMILIVGRNPVKTLSEFCGVLNETVPNFPVVANGVLPAGNAILWRREDAEAVLVRTKPPRVERKRHSRKYAEGNLGP